ncbi:UNVERIFIED_ORG: hypothetical protein GGI57_001351 [Rhizobium aethiopicum]|uniref:hypothetical protein n=1 Tax=Rhizobium TaxID=379 RepID=UPI00185C89C0|nr:MULTISPECIES: hypothetical protein [Rhizobium]
MHTIWQMNTASPAEEAKHVEHWLRTEIVATYDAHEADPTKAKPLDEVWKRLEARMDEIDREE